MMRLVEVLELLNQWIEKKSFYWQSQERSSIRCFVQWEINCRNERLETFIHSRGECVQWKSIEALSLHTLASAVD